MTRRTWKQQEEFLNSQSFQTSNRKTLLRSLRKVCQKPVEESSPYPIKPLNYHDVPWDNPNFKRSKVILYTIIHGRIWFGFGVGGSSGRLCLIGGTKEEGETLNQTMLREIDEEIGNAALNHIDFLSGVYFNLGFAWSGFLYLDPQYRQPIPFQRQLQEVSKLAWFTPYQFSVLLEEAFTKGAYRSTFRLPCDFEKLSLVLPFLIQSWSMNTSYLRWKYLPSESPRKSLLPGIVRCSYEEFVDRLYSSTGRETVIAHQQPDQWVYALPDGSVFYSSLEEETVINKHLQFLRPRILSTQKYPQYRTQFLFEFQEGVSTFEEKLLNGFRRSDISPEEREADQKFLFLDHLFSRVDNAFYNYDDRRNVRKIFQKKGRYSHDVYVLFMLLGINDLIMKNRRNLRIVSGYRSSYQRLKDNRYLQIEGNMIVIR